ncbi:prepilin-type N-terminal cleavage/methylation domain-containing protein [Candidatus Daviesbacteria bacterium]|nr:prepilin-type N-terminal cleavage/methylation domain-containing protein [Candidatus Daviesbacteria bacterium]
MGKAAPNAFTLIELLVVISVVAILGVVAIPSFRNFGEEQALNNALLDLQSNLRTAQTNASTNLKCANQPVDQWKIDFYKQQGKYIVQTHCYYFNGAVLTQSVINKYELPSSIIIEKIFDSGSAGCENTFPTDVTSYAAVIFKPLTNAIYFESSIDRVTYQTCNQFQVQLKNTKTTSTKQVIIEKGGRVYVQ